MDAPGRCGCVRLDGRPAGPQGAADDLHPVVFHLQLHRRFLADLHIPAGVPHPAGHRHGCRVAGRRGAGDGDLADPVARPDVGIAAEFLGAGLSDFGSALRDDLRLHRLAQACCGSGVLPALAVVWIRFYVKEPEVWVENQRLQNAQSAQVRAPLLAIFRRKITLEHDHGLHVDVERLRDLLRHIRPVRDLPAKGPEDVGGGGRLAFGVGRTSRPSSRRSSGARLPTGSVAVGR